MKTFILLFIFFVLSVTPALAQKKVAVVKLLRGDVSVLTIGKTAKLKADDWVEEGAVVKTGDKSFVKLVFIDKSQMNVGPNSEMKIENYSGKDSGVIDLVKGKIRSQVTKDYLQMDKDKSKLFIKTQNAVMGVRGTDFMITTNGVNSSVVLFEGEVVFNKLDDRNITSSAALENVVDKGVRMFPGEFSVLEQNRPQPTVPSLLNVQQRESLEKSDGTESGSDRVPSNVPKETKSVVPEGLSGEVVSNKSETLKTEVAQLAPQVAPTSDKPASQNANGFVDGDKVKPANGSFLHVESGIIIPPAPDSVLDANTNTYVAGTGNGTVSKDGSYVPPQNVKISDSGVITVTTKSESGVVTEQKVAAPPPVKTDATRAPSTFTVAPPPPPGGLLPRIDVMNKGLLPVNQNQLPAWDPRIQNQMENQTFADKTKTTIRVRNSD